MFAEPRSEAHLRSEIAQGSASMLRRRTDARPPGPPSRRSAPTTGSDGTEVQSCSAWRAVSARDRLTRGTRRRGAAETRGLVASAEGWCRCTAEWLLAWRRTLPVERRDRSMPSLPARSVGRGVQPTHLLHFLARLYVRSHRGLGPRVVTGSDGIHEVAVVLMGPQQLGL